MFFLARRVDKNPPTQKGTQFVLCACSVPKTIICGQDIFICGTQCYWRGTGAQKSFRASEPKIK